MLKRLCLGLLFASGCVGQPPAAPEGPVAQAVTQAAVRNHVPRDLMLAIGAVEGGLLLSKIRMLRIDEDVPVGGVLELRHGKFNSLQRGAELMGTDEDTLRVDTDLATEAGARVLAELGQKYGAGSDLGSWRQPVEELSGLGDVRAREDYLERVFSVLKAGGTFPARDGEEVTIAAHPDLEIPSRTVAEAAGPTPDFPGAIWFTTSCTNKCTIGRPDGNASVNTIVIHDTEGGWDASVATLQYDSGKSVHYIVDADGKRVGQFRPETDTTYHAGNYEVNKHSVGIEHVGYAGNASGYSTGLYDKSVALVKSIRSRWKVPLDRQHIFGHYQVPDGSRIGESSPPCSLTLDECETSPNYGGASNHRDPGYHWQWCQYMEKLGGSCTCNDAYTLWNCTTDKTEAVRCNNGKVEIDHCDAGCDVMAIGVNDVCNHTPAPSPSPDPSASPSPSPSVGPSPEGPGSGGSGAQAGGSGSESEGTTPSGGCAMAGEAAPSAAPLALIGMALLGLALGRRSRRA